MFQRSIAYHYTESFQFLGKVNSFVLSQGLKRLMTFCQKKFPADPSKSVEYNAVK